MDVNWRGMRTNWLRVLPTRPLELAARRRLSEAIYGTIVVLSVLDYVDEENESAAECAVTVGIGAAVLFLARIYSQVLSERTSPNHARGEVRRGPDRADGARPADAG